MKKKNVRDLELGSNVYSICRKRANLASEVGVFEYKAIIENESIRRLWNDGSPKRINKTKKYVVECTKDVGQDDIVKEEATFATELVSYVTSIVN